MSLLSSFFGHGPSWDNGYKGMVLGNYRDYLTNLEAQFSPEAIRNDTSNYIGNLDRSLANQMGAQGLSYGRRGLRAQPNFALRRAGLGAGFRANAEQAARAGRTRGLAGAAQMLQGMAPLFYRAGSRGLIGGLTDALAPVAQAWGMTQGAPRAPQAPKAGQDVWDSLAPEQRQLVQQLLYGG